MRPILIVCCASAGAPARMAAAKPARPTRVCRIAVLSRRARAQRLARPLGTGGHCAASPPPNSLPRLLPSARPRRILDLLDLVERDIDEFAADLLHPPDINRLYDVARLGIDRHRATRAIPCHALGRRDQGLAVGLAAGPLDRRGDGVHAVIAADRAKVG